MSPAAHQISAIAPYRWHVISNIAMPLGWEWQQRTDTDDRFVREGVMIDVAWNSRQMRQASASNGFTIGSREGSKLQKLCRALGADIRDDERFSSLPTTNLARLPDFERLKRAAANGLKVIHDEARIPTKEPPQASAGRGPLARGATHGLDRSGGRLIKKHEITREDVLQAIAEYDALGRDKFLTKYKMGMASEYFVDHDGREYDSKAILAAAHGFHPGLEPLRPSDFSGGLSDAIKHLRRLGFNVPVSREPTWSRDELILACDLVRENNWKGLSPADPRVIALSDLLQQLPIHPPEVRGRKFRNPNGVGRKTYDIATHHPDYTGKPTNAGALDVEVLHCFLEREFEMREVARSIREGIVSGDLDDAFSGTNEVEPVAVDSVPTEANDKTSYEFQQLGTKTAVKREAELTHRFEAYLRETHQHSVARYRIATAGSSGNQFTDLADETAKILYEAKGITNRMSVRLALGQILDYGRYVKKRYPGTELSLLLPQSPPADMIELLESLGIGCVVEKSPSEFVDQTNLGRCP